MAPFDGGSPSNHTLLEIPTLVEDDQQVKSFFHHTFRIIDVLGERLKNEREARGLRQHELAAAGHVTRFTQAGYESESTYPNTAYLKAIQETGVDLHYILSGTHHVGLPKKAPLP